MKCRVCHTYVGTWSNICVLIDVDRELAHCMGHEMRTEDRRMALKVGQETELSS